MKVAVWGRNLEDFYLRSVSQLGADAIDELPIPNEPGTGYFDLKSVLNIKKKIHSYGMEVNRVSLPYLSENYMGNGDGAEEELENCSQCLRVLGEAGMSLARVGFAKDTYPWMRRYYEAKHRGGYFFRGESLSNNLMAPSPADQDLWWQRVCHAYDKLVPIAEDFGVRLMMHPSDPPSPGAPFGGLGFHRLIDAFPNRCVGYLYCCGTRAEAGGQSLVLDEINNYGRKGRIFMVHFRNVRGSLATAGAFEEVMLDDGDMNMFEVLQELQRVGFEGYLQPDHCPPVGDDLEDAIRGVGYAVGYIKGLLAVLASG
ncbi:MAG: Mannonate dehydratase [Candidatus Moanabacter tarae]|uniref:mannonate dehydratase n=1 Tax=Candidatus Moanibacter tarae TaxID=2200854 RepID=A0A2Z4ANT7_9BACT|nr:MAG: Mannonate dehydratase [Candidatus Moanabacter tarae]